MTKIFALPGAPFWVLLIWWISLSVVATGLMIAIDHVSRRLLPLAALLKLSLFFPDEAPSRFQTALKTLTPSELTEEIERAKAGEATRTPVHSAEQLLRFVAALDTHDSLTRGHSERVRAYSQMLAKELELSSDEIDRLNWAALLHDVGKLTVPAAILAKVGKPTDEEWQLLRSHPDEGERLAGPLRSWLGEWFDAIGDHHEKWDGSGYPNGSAGENISLAGRIVAIADVFDVITSARSYKDGASAEAARVELTESAGAHFDPQLVRAFLNISLGRMRVVMGPLSWLAHISIIGRLPLTPAVGGALGTVAVGATAVTGTVVNQPPAKEPVRAVAAQPAPPATPPPPIVGLPAETPAEPSPEPEPEPDEPAPLPGPEEPPPPPPPPPAGVARDIAASTSEDTTTAIDLEIPNPESVTEVRITGPPAAGTASVNEDGQIEYTPEPNHNGSVTIEYETCWSNGVCDRGSVTINVTPVNDAPIAADDTMALREGEVVLIDALSNDSDVDGDALALTLSSTPVGNARVVDSKIRYRPPPDFVGIDIVDYTVDDGGGGRAGARLTLTVKPVNDAPSFKIRDVVVAEDSGAGDVAGWVSAVSPGPANESSQVVTVTLVNDRSELFASAPTVGADGSLSFEPAADVYGIATLTTTATDDGGTANDGEDTSAPEAVTLTIKPVNDPPVFVAGADVIADEDSGAQSLGGWASAISPGPGGESAQTVSFIVTTDNPSLFATAPALASDGTLSFEPAPHAFGTATVTVSAADDGGTANGGIDRSAPRTVAFLVGPINDRPSFTAGASVAVNEDPGPQSLSGWATSISPGPANESGQSVSFVVANDNAPLFATPPALAADGTLSFEPAPGANGVADLTITAIDDGGTASGGVDTSAPQVVSLAVGAVNDPPSFTAGPAVVANEDSGAQTLVGWASAISPGPANESAQSVTFTVVSDNPSLFTTAPALAPNGTLTFTSVPGAYGAAVLTITAMDDGGTANGGVDTSSPQIVALTVNSVNDPPSFTAGPRTVNEDAGPQSLSGWATSISPGPANESAQSVTFTVVSDNPSLFSTAPALAPNGTLTFETAAEANGGATLTVTAVDDGGTANGGVDASPPQNFALTVNAVNDAPSFTAGAAVTVNEDDAAQTLPNWVTGIGPGPANESTQSVSLTVTNDNAALFSAAPAVAADGTLTFTTAPDAHGSATLTITAQDDGGTANGGVDTSAAQMVTVTVDPVNDAPDFVAGADAIVNEDGGPFLVAGWATSITAGAASEEPPTQTLTFNVVANDNPGLFASGPAIDPMTGDLTFDTASDAFGVANVDFNLTDDGGTANGGVDTSATRSLQITVGAVNDAPSFVQGTDQTVLGESGAHVIGGWATTISPGPANEAGQTVSFNTVGNTDPSLFSVAPQVTPGGALTFTVASGQLGSATITIELTDNGGTANGGVDTSPSQAFEISVAKPSVVISEVRARGQASNTDDFVELYNTSASPVDISGWQVDVVDSGSPETVIIPGSTVLAPGQHYLIAHATNYSGSAAPDQVWADNIHRDATISLRTAGAQLIDQVGMGTFAGEGTSLPAMTDNIEQSYERLEGTTLGNCRDTNDNKADFVHNWGRSGPENYASSPAVPCAAPTTATHVTISEFRSSGPAGLADEFFEILNPTSSPVDISGWRLVYLGLTLHTFAGGTILAPAQRYVVASPLEYTGLSDATFNGIVIWPYTGGIGASVRLETGASALIDAVGWNSGIGEGTPLPGVLPFASADRSYERRHGGCTDTDDNLPDFIASYAATPGAGSCQTTLFLSSSGSSSEEWDLTSTPPPPAAPVPDYDGDTDPGLTIRSGNGGESETDPLKRHEWIYVPITPLNFTGPVKLGLWASAKDFATDKREHPYVFLYDCLPGGASCVKFHEGDVHIDPWNIGATWTYRELDLGAVSYTIAVGRELRMLMTNNHEEIWIAMTQAYPSRLIVG